MHAMMHVLNDCFERFGQRPKKGYLVAVMKKGTVCLK
jgi:hypothetical protein